MYKDVNKFPNYAMPSLEPTDFRDKDGRTLEHILYMLNRLQRCVKISGGSESLPGWRIIQLLMQQGKGFVYPHEGKLRFLLGNLGGKPDEWYMPTEFVFANPALEWSGNIPIRDGVLWKCDSRMVGFIPLLKKYATLLVENELSIYLSIITTRATHLIQTGNGQDAGAAREYLKDLENGKIGVLIGQNILNGIKVQPYGGSTTSLTDYIEMEQYIKASMYNELGLDSNYNMKRESLNSTEAQMNSDALLPLIHDFFKCSQEAIDEINEKFGEYLEYGPITIEWDSSWALNEKEIELELESVEANVDLIEETIDETDAVESSDELEESEEVEILEDDEEVETKEEE